MTNLQLGIHIGIQTQRACSCANLSAEQDGSHILIRKNGVHVATLSTGQNLILQTAQGRILRMWENPRNLDYKDLWLYLDRDW